MTLIPSNSGELKSHKTMILKLTDVYSQGPVVFTFSIGMLEYGVPQ